MHDLPHRGKIIGTFDRFDVEFAVVIFRRLSVFKDDTRACGVSPLNVRVVETFQMTRLHRHTQVGLHLGHDALNMTVRIDDLNVLELFLSVVQGVLDAEVDEFSLLPFLWDVEGGAFNLKFHRVGSENGARRGAEEVPNLRDGQVQERSRLFVQFLFDLHRIALHNSTLNHL